MKWLKFAFRNVLRNRRRSLVTIALIAVGAAAILATQGFSHHTNEMILERTVNSSGGIIVSHPDFFERDEEKVLEMGLADYPSLISSLKADSRIKHVLPTIRFNGMVSNGDKTVIFYGVAHDATYFHREDAEIKFVSGTHLSMNPNPDKESEIILGKDLAKSLSVSVGDSLTLLSTTSSGVLNAIDFTVVGTVDVGVNQLNKSLIYTHISDTQELLDTDKIHTLSIHLYDFAQIPSLLTELQQNYPDLGITPWSDHAETYNKVKDVFGSIFGVIGVIVFIMVAFSVSNTMSQAVVERTREIGTMGALGTSKMLIVTNFIMEALIIGAIGVAIGVVLAFIAGFGLDVFNAQMPPGPGFTNPYPLRLLISISLIIDTLISLLIACFLASWFAASRGVKKPIVEALTHV